ncbi:MAG: IPT/TIG domain-containing protein, partial [Gammaproteobacteria bacterium]
DVVGHSTQTAPVRIGKVEDTVAPKLDVLQPFNRDILTANEPVRAVVAVEDLGSEADRRVMTKWIREYQDSAGIWQPLAERDVELFRDDTRAPDDETPVSDPDNYYYIYWADVLDGAIFSRTDYPNERVRVVTTVSTPNHTTTIETFHEVGLPITERRYLKPSADSPASVAKSVYYTAIDQFVSDTQTGGMIASWSNIDPMRLEQGLGNLLLNESFGQQQQPVKQLPRTGLFILDAVDETSGSNGDVFIHSELLSGASELFSGVITEIKADANFVIAAKSGVLPGTSLDNTDGEFAQALRNEIETDTTTGDLYLDNTNGELLIFNVRNGDGQFGLPYLLAGRIDMPYPDVYGLSRKDNVVFVANGHGGVQVVDISSLSAPYHVGYIKPNGFTRDVAVKDRYAFIAASNEGLVVADILDPSMPIVATLDTLGVANRIKIDGDKLYLTDMAGDGFTSQLNIIDISDPYQPRILKTVTLEPNREDFVPDGTYDVTIGGSQAFVTVHSSDQEDQPIQSIVEIIDLNSLDNTQRDATVPAVIHRDATPIDFAARGITIARGGVHVAAGRQGFSRIELPTLTVLRHTPVADEQQVSTELPAIEIELSAVLPDSTVLSDYVRVMEGDPLIGVDVTAKFTLDFATRNGQPARRFIRLTRNDIESLVNGTQYYVVIQKGLLPLTGRALPSDYQFSFTTSKAGAALAPDIVSITPSTGSIQGGTQVVVRGTNFGDNPQLYIGGQRLVIDNVEAPTTDDPYEKLVARTVPNYAGPAAVEVVNTAGLNDYIVGGFTYVDILQISFIDPPVVRVNQSGVGDSVSIVGYGFHDGVEIRAYKSGQPDTAVTDVVDNDRLSLYSSERMSWVVPDFGDSYRGFVDVQVSDDTGRRYLVTNALFYGRLQIDRQLEAEAPLTKDEIADLNALDNNRKTYVPDPLKLPPGSIADLASDADLRYVYVLGRGELAVGPESASSLDYFRTYFAPGWISLVHYQRDDLGNAAPLHGLGYFNLPQDLSPSTLHLGDKHLYVAAQGYDFPLIDTTYEGQNLVLVYEREMRLPDSPDLPDGKDRDVLYSLPLNFTQVPTTLVGKDKLLFAGSQADGVAVISAADPLKLSVIRVIKRGIVNGVAQDLQPVDLQIVGKQLHVQSKNGRYFVFDMTKPSIPQLGVTQLEGVTSLLPDNKTLAVSSKSIDLAMMDVSRANYARQIGAYDGRGFSIPGTAVDVDSQTTMITTATVAQGDCKGNEGFAAIFDTSRTDEIGLVDALQIHGCDKKRAFSHSVLSNDGLLIGAITPSSSNTTAVSELFFMDTLTLDLVASYPVNNAVAAATDRPLSLTFNRPVDIPDGESAAAYLARYLSLI